VNWEEVIEIYLWFRCDEDGIYEDDEEFPDEPCRADWDVFYDTDETFHKTNGETVESVCPACGRKARQYLMSVAERNAEQAEAARC